MPKQDFLDLLYKVRTDLTACHAFCGEHGLTQRGSIDHMLSDLRVVTAWAESDAQKRVEPLTPQTGQPPKCVPVLLSAALDQARQRQDPARRLAIKTLNDERERSEREYQAQVEAALPAARQHVATTLLPQIADAIVDGKDKLILPVEPSMKPLKAWIIAIEEVPGLLAREGAYTTSRGGYDPFIEVQWDLRELTS